MSGRYGNENDPFAAISTSPEVMASLRRRLTTIEQGADTLRAQSFIEALEVLKPGEA